MSYVLVPQRSSQEMDNCGKKRMRSRSGGGRNQSIDGSLVKSEHVEEDCSAEDLEEEDFLIAQCLRKIIIIS